MCASRILILIVAAAVGGLPLAAAAQSAGGEANKAQLRRLQQAQRQLQQEKQQLQAERTRLEAELDDSRRQAASEARRAAGLSREAGTLRQRESELGGRVAALEAELKTAREQLRAAGAESRQLQGRLAESTRQQGLCMEQVKGLRETGATVLSLYESKGCFGALLQREPLTGLGGVAVENAVEDLRDRLAGETRQP